MTFLPLLSFLSCGVKRGFSPAACLARGDRRVLAGAGEECVDVGGELGVVLDQEPVGGVGVDLDLSMRDHVLERVRQWGRIIGSLSPLATSTGMPMAASR